MNKYGKLFWAVAGAVVFAVKAALTDGLSAPEVIGIIIAGGGAVIVWMAPDTTINDTVKSWAGALMAGLLITETAVIGGLTTDEIFDIGIAVLTAAGVIIDPRRPVHLIQRSSMVAPGP